MSESEMPELVAPASTSRVPLWLAAVVVALLVLVFVLAGAFIKVKLDERRTGMPDAALELLEEQAKGSKDTKVLLELAFEYRKAGLLEEALRTNRRVISLDSRNVAARYHVGSILLEIGEQARAEESFWDVLEIDPTHAQSAKALGELYAEAGHYRSLLVAVEPAAAASPALADLQFLVGLGREKTGDGTGAAKAYWDALELDPSMSAARDGLDRVGGGRP